MRLQEKATIILSDDSTNEPKQIRFRQEFEDIDVTLLKESITRQEKFPIGSTVISMGQIAQGKFFVIKPTKAIQLKLNNSLTLLNVRANKFTKMWIDFTSVEIVTTEEQDVLIVIAGE